MQNIWRKTRRAAGMLLACAMLASMIPAQALAQEADGTTPAEDSAPVTTTLPAEDPAPEEEAPETVTEPVTEEGEGQTGESVVTELPAPEESPAVTETTDPVVTEETPLMTETPEVTPAPEAAGDPAETPAEPIQTPAQPGEEIPESRMLPLDALSEDREDGVEYTITVKFHECLNYLDDWEWVHQVRTTTVTVDEEQINDYWSMDAAQLANAVMGYDAFSTVDFWLNGTDQPVVSGHGTEWTVDLYVNLHAWGRVPDSYVHSTEPGSPWDGNLVCNPLYQIQNRSADLTVGYTFRNASGSESGTLASGQSLNTSLAVDGIAAAIFFVKAPAGYTGNGVAFSDGTAGDVYPIDQISHWQGAYCFTAEIAAAKANGYTHAFYFTQWSGEERRWFSVDVVPETYDITYNLDGGVLSASNPLTYDVTELENGGIPLNNPTRTGYIFLGWTLDGGTDAATTAMTIAPGTVGNLTFTAHWQIRSDLSYTVRYLEQGTDKVLADARLVDGQIYNTTVTEQALTIDGYRVVGEDTRTLTVDVPENGDNVLVFYYEAVSTGTEEKPETPSHTGNNGSGGNQNAEPQDTNTAETVQASAAETVLAVPAGLPLMTGPVAGTIALAAPRTLTDNGTPAVQEPAEEEMIPETEPPLTRAPAEQETIGDSETPLAAYNGGWALINLILAAVTVLGGLLLALGNKNNAWRVFSLIPAMAAIVAFIVTENVTTSMVVVDRWTLLMALIALVQGGVAVLSRQNKADGNRADA